MAAINRSLRGTFTRQLIEILKAEVARSAIGARFYADREIHRKYQVSFSVARAALGALAAEGYIRRDAARGTFVESHQPRRPARGPQTITVFGSIEGYCPQSAAIRGIEEQLRPQGHDLVIRSNQQDGQAIDPGRMVSRVIRELRHSAGVIWIGSFLEQFDRWPAALTTYARRIVFINVFAKGGAISSVIRDDSGGAFQLTTHLLERGAHRIGFLGGLANRTSARLRYEGFVHALAVAGRVPEKTIVLPFTTGQLEADGQASMRQILRRGRAPDALVCVTDRMARGAMEVLKSEGYRIPRDVALGGFDNSPTAEALDPPLTSVDAAFVEAGRAATSLLLGQIAGTVQPGTKYYVPCSLIVRASSERATVAR